MVATSPQLTQTTDSPFNYHFAVPSNTERKLYHVVMMVDEEWSVVARCSCAGFTYRGNCSHCESAWESIKRGARGGATKATAMLAPNSKGKEDE